MTSCAYTNYAVFFRLGDEEKCRAVQLLGSGLERTLAQTRHLCGTIEKDVQGGYSFVKRRESSVQVVIHNMDPNAGNPTLDDLEKGHFGGESMKDVKLWSIPRMTWGERPEADPENRPAVSAYQINLCVGGLVLVVQAHHYALDAMAYSEKMVDSPPAPERHPDHLEQQAVLLHLPKSKAAELKRLATPEGDSLVSTYDASCAYLWRVLTKVRADLYMPSRDTVLWWGEAVNLRPRLHSRPLAQRLMRNALSCAFSDTTSVSPLTVAEVVDKAPLSKLACYIRALTDSCNEEHADVSSFDFGFGKPITHRHLFGGFSTAGAVIMYAPIRSEDPNEGCVFTVTMEKELVDKMRAMREFSNFFEYRGVD
ncbi:uncharacterized protein PpBr36_10967 [Pyricularia pennisetigena]|uniref:uncharacterized protein n=1 Tax=Pyricularia pennisetigena TaxID=1578925 RepID=UPI00115416EC|nr:uncharacterized protein PpBr36_10967 [Pyricularia pennisetigena]TLS20738.1 hypothetical protein PpBr36_10967 [Pyricularia pennisetigena]